MPQLVFYRDGREVLRFPIHADEIGLGRHPDNDISLPNLEVSRFHAVLKQKGDIYYLINRSRAGTRLRGQSIDEVALTDQDVFEVGPWTILFEVNGLQDLRETTIGSDGEEPSAPLFHGMIGQSAVMKEVFHLIQKAAPSDLPVMITGETGTGKELVARSLHALTTHRYGPFIAINCGAIAANLIESELFGHERGSFTGAIGQHKGTFEQAHGGTLFLDEIGELPIELQAKLLRILEDGSFRRIGGSVDVRVDVRIVAATHRSLPKDIQSGRFREDLYYRLMGIVIELPPLRERREDIPLLAQHFMTCASPSKVTKGLLPEAERCLQDYHWPGNIRELKSVLARSLLLCDKEILGESDLHFDPVALSQKDPSLQGTEREAILAKLRELNGNKTKTAEELGIAKSTLFRKLKEHGITDHDA